MFTRRHLLAGSAAVAAASCRCPRSAAAPASGKQAAAFYRYKIGSYELTAIHDGVWLREIDYTFVRNAGWNAVAFAMADAHMSPQILPTPFTPVVVNTGSKLVMIDTGTGGQFPAPSGSFLANLDAAGIDPKAIDLDPHLALPCRPHQRSPRQGRRHRVSKRRDPRAGAEWAYWMNDANMMKAPESARPVWLNVRRIFKRHRGPREPLRERQGARARHRGDARRPGIHRGIRRSRSHRHGQSMLVLGDVTNNPYLFLRHPDWQGTFDVDGPLAVETRRKVFDRAAADRMLVQGYHFPFPATGYVNKTASGYDLVPVMWQPAL